MHIREQSRQSSFWQDPCKILLASCWLVGIISGFLCAGMGNHSFLMMRGASYEAVSIVDLFVVLLLPFLFSAFAVFISQRWLIFVIAFLKAFCFSFCSCGVTLAFDSVGWLLVLLLMFSDICSLPVLVWFWLRSLSPTGRMHMYDTLVYLTAALCIGCIDYCIVSPFLASLL